jgi:hypothetical protein
MGVGEDVYLEAVPVVCRLAPDPIELEEHIVGRCRRCHACGEDAREQHAGELWIETQLGCHAITLLVSMMKSMGTASPG